MRERALLSLLLSLLVPFLIASPSSAQIPVDEEGKLTVYGDLRFRFEEDWDSIRPDGSSRDERSRLRLRARVGFNWQPVEPISFGLRLRSGLRRAQQSPHLTFWDFDGNGNDPAGLVFDRWFVNLGESGGTQAWFGRNSDPFWKQNELFWDDDVSLTGATLGWSREAGHSKLRLVGGFYALPDGMEAFAGQLAAGQFIYDHHGPHLDASAVSGFFWIRGAPETTYLRNGNGTRDYKIWTADFQARARPMAIPVSIGLDVMHNFQNYSPDDPDPFTAANYDQNTGWVGSITLGETRERWDWLAAYYYAHIETFAVNASFAEDDWMRWGSEGQTDASDFKGQELRFAMALARKTNLVARLYLLEAITSVQDGKRFRLDLNCRF